jgi:N-acetylneuraminic acid mutarotase
MISMLSSWLRRERRLGRRSRLRPARRPACKPSLEVLESRTVLSSWATVAPMPTARHLLAAAAGADGRIYAMGGFGPNVFATVETYNSTTDSWSTVAPMPTARSGLAAALGADGRIYAIGGSDNNKTTLNTVEAYDAFSNSWFAVAPLSTARQALAAVAGVDGRIYTIGGFNGSNASNTVEAYNPGTNSWSTVSSLPTARFALAAAAGSDGRIYAIGGFNGSTYVDTVEAYDPGSNTWSAVAPMPTSRSTLAAAAAADGRIYAVGGFNGSTILSTAEAYDPGSNSWFTVAPMPTSRSGLAAAAGAVDRIYAIGGFNNASGPLNTVEAYSPFIVLIGNHILQVKGNSNLPDRLIVTDDRHWGIQVILNDHSLGVFHGIDRVEINTGGGGDSLHYMVAGGSGRPADLMVDLGNGGGTFTLDSLSPAAQDLGSARPWQIDVHTGGDSQVRANFQGSVPLHMNVALGTGTNVVDLAFDQIMHMPAASDVTVDGGSGDNAIHITYGFIPTLERAPLSEAPIATTINGGLGTDTVTLNFNFAPLLDAGAGTNTIGFNIPLRTNVQGGQRGNDIRVLFSQVPGPLPEPLVAINAPVMLNLTGGGGTDNILVQFMSSPFSERPGPLMALNSVFQMRLDGDDGNDRIEADLYFAAQSRGSVDAQVQGGSGDDYLMLAIYGLADRNVHAQIDGGSGFDMVVATRNVMVRNCEEIRWL